VEIGTLSKITAKKAGEICALAAAAGRTLPDPGDTSPAEYVKKLISVPSLDEAVQFMAFALPKREAVWWACLCARSQVHDSTPAAALAALTAAEAWVYRPTDETRRAAMEKAQATRFDSALIWPAVAAFWSGGSLAPPNLPAVPPAPHLSGVAVLGAVTLAAVQIEPALAEQKRRRYIEIAIDIANGGSGRVEAKRA
jgi:hypothetical protein